MLLGRLPADDPAYQGFMPVNLHDPGQFARIVADLSALRQAAGTAAQPCDVVALFPVGRT